jgi:predicted dehydrogenase
MSSPNRRSFLGHVAGAALAFPFVGCRTLQHGTAARLSPGSNVRVAAFGANGRAFGDISGAMGVKNTTLVAVAEVDDARTDKVREHFSKAKIYRDWRELLDKEGKNIDVAVIGTPDHMHAPIALAAMQLGKHVYVEKPLTRTLHETRMLTRYAASHGLISQMGNQLASGTGNKTTAKAVRDGVIGKIIAVHSMCPKSWGSMSPLPNRADPVPEGLDWDQWIGVAKMRPFIKGEFHPGQWRKRIGYGTGTLGDMACHIVHPWVKGLGSPPPVSVRSVGPAPVDSDSWPLDGQIEYTMSGNALTLGDFPFTWYDGKNIPTDEVAAFVGGRKNVPKMGSIIIGTTGVIAVNHGGDSLPKIYRDGLPTDEKPDQPDAADHHGEFIDRVRGEASSTVCDFSYAGPMTETVLLGTIAMRRPGELLRWDSAGLQFTNSNEANAMVREDYRDGWQMNGL